MEKKYEIIHQTKNKFTLEINGLLNIEMLNKDALKLL